MTARKAAHSLQRAKGALASGFATVDLHHATGYSAAIWKELARQSRWDCCVADSGSLAA